MNNAIIRIRLPFLVWVLLAVVLTLSPLFKQDHASLPTATPSPIWSLNYSKIKEVLRRELKGGFYLDSTSLSWVASHKELPVPADVFPAY